jgi:hypothetical protein
VAPRSNWKGYLKLSLVSASIAIYPATSSGEKVRFNTLNRQTGNRLKRQMVDSVTGDVVESEEQVKGYAVAKDQYVIVEDDELANIAIESTRTVDIEKFVPKASIDDRYRDTPYYLAPEDQVGQEAFAVIRDAMKKKKMVGIARVVMARRERVMMLEPFGKGIMGTLLLYPLRDQGRRRCLRGDPGAETARANGGPCRGNHRPDDRRVRARHIPGSLRECDDRAYPIQAGGTARQNREGPFPSRQCSQPDGCAKAQHRGGQRHEEREGDSQEGGCIATAQTPGEGLTARGKLIAAARSRWAQFLTPNVGRAGHHPGSQTSKTGTPPP